VTSASESVLMSGSSDKAIAFVSSRLVRSANRIGTFPGEGLHSQIVRSASAVDSATAVLRQHCQLADLLITDTANTANIGKRRNGQT
jgi:hypothetical protein